MKRWLNHISIQGQVGILTLVGLGGLLLIAMFLVYEQYEQSFAQRQAQVRHAVETADKARAGLGRATGGQRHLVACRGPAMASAAIAKMRYGHGEYFSDEQTWKAPRSCAPSGQSCKARVAMPCAMPTACWS